VEVDFIASQKVGHIAPTRMPIFVWEPW